MLSIENVAQKYRSLRLTAIANELGSIVSQAQDNELSYLHLADMLVEKELNQRNSNRIELNGRKAGFPGIKV